MANIEAGFAVDMNNGLMDDEYGVVHVSGCRACRDGENIGEDLREGLADLGTEWLEDYEDGLIKLASCAKTELRKRLSWRDEL